MCIHPVAMRSAVFHIVCSFVLCVVDAIGNHIVEACTEALVLITLRLRMLKQCFRVFDSFCRGDYFW